MRPLARRAFLKSTATAAALAPLAAPRGLASLFVPADFAPETPFYRLRLNPQRPGLADLSVDALGRRQLGPNPLEALPAAETVARPSLREDARRAEYRVEGQAVWTVEARGDRRFRLTTHHRAGYNEPFTVHFIQHRNHAAFLGMMGAEANVVHLPAMLHLPGMGSVRVTTNDPGATVRLTADRFLMEDPRVHEPFIQIDFPAATPTDPVRTYDFEVVALYPDVPSIRGDRRFDAFRRDYISIFQVNPNLRVLANNTASDPCAFTLFEYAEVAPYAPPLASGLTALDLIRMTLDNYMSGTKGYGQLGYRYDGPGWLSAYNSLDSYPSLVLSAALYALSANDRAWFQRSRAKIGEWAQIMLDTDGDHDGLLEYGYSGNSHSWKGDHTQRPANWWDTVGYGHKDAFSNAIAYRALRLLSEAHRRYGDLNEASRYAGRARRMKALYVPTFLNPDTGILGGWRSADGELHDYWFTSVNAMAIAHGLVEPALGNQIMDRMLAKMREVGFTNFRLGLPGNLVPIAYKDYAHHVLRWGGGTAEDGSDGFQIYENGGATACWAYYTVKALYDLGRVQDADAILIPMLQAMDAGEFQGMCENGMSKDWKKWNGECWGYEGFLVDNYLVMLAVIERDKHIG